VTRVSAWSWRSTTGNSRCARGLASAAPTSPGSRPSRCAQAVKLRAAAARLASDVRAAPVLRSRASQLRSTRRSRSAGLVPPIRAAWSSNETMSATYPRTVFGDRPRSLARWRANRSTAERMSGGRSARVSWVRFTPRPCPTHPESVKAPRRPPWCSPPGEPERTGRPLRTARVPAPRGLAGRAAPRAAVGRLMPRSGPDPGRHAGVPRQGSGTAPVRGDRCPAPARTSPTSCSASW
jgi:hypothetical protein